MQGNVNIPDSTITTNLSFRQLVLMNMQQLTNFPYIENNFDALTDYELLCLVVKFLNDVIDNQNEQNASITNMYNAFLALQTYVNNTKDTLEDAFNTLDDYVRNFFDNLDLQDEVNNKLDQMLEDGVLEQIIEQFLQSTAIWCFDTVADMKAATNLISGSYARTLGYYSINDGGGALYYITDTESLSEYQEELNTNLYATLISSDYVTPEMFGAYGDNTHDDGDKLVNIKQFSNVIFGKGKTYLSSKTITLDSPISINLNGSTIKMYDRLSETSALIFHLSGNNIILENGNLLGDSDSRETYPETIHGIRVSGNNIEVKNLNISKFCADGITTTGNNVILHDLDVGYCGRNNISMLYGENVKMFNICVHDNEHKMNPGHGIDIEPYADNQKVDNLEIYNISSYNNYGSGINLSFYDDVDVLAKVHDVNLNDYLSIKLNNNPSGNLYLNNITINTKALTIQDPCSSTFNTYISNVNIINHTPNVITSFWGSAFLIRSGVVYTGDIYNLNINNVNIIDGTSTYGLYISNVSGHVVNNSEVKNLYCNRNNIKSIIGTNCSGLVIENINSNYILDSTTDISLYNFAKEININSSNNSITISSGFSCKDYIKINNVKTSDLAITSQNNNNFGTTLFRLPAKRSCLLKVNSDGTCNVISSRVRFIIAANSSMTLNLCNTNEILLTRSSYREIYKVIANETVQLHQNSATGGTISIDDNVATISNTSTGNLGVIFDI